MKITIRLFFVSIDWFGGQFVRTDNFANICWNSNVTCSQHSFYNGVHWRYGYHRYWLNKYIGKCNTASKSTRQPAHARKPCRRCEPRTVRSNGVGGYCLLLQQMVLSFLYLLFFAAALRICGGCGERLGVAAIFDCLVAQFTELESFRKLETFLVSVAMPILTSFFLSYGHHYVFPWFHFTRWFVCPVCKVFRNILLLF